MLFFSGNLMVGYDTLIQMIWMPRYGTYKPKSVIAKIKDAQITNSFAMTFFALLHSFPFPLFSLLPFLIFGLYAELLNFLVAKLLYKYLCPSVCQVWGKTWFSQDVIKIEVHFFVKIRLTYEHLFCKYFSRRSAG